MSTKILIIKLGYSETLDREIGKVPSLGDVLRTTPILWAIKEKYPDSHITWLVAENAEPLLVGNRFIDRILVWDEFIPFQLMREKFDILINLEKIAGICALSDMIDAWGKYGFRFDTTRGAYHGYEKGLDFIRYLDNKKTDIPKGCWQQVLIEMMGMEWKEQPYMIGYSAKKEGRYDVGFNYEVGSKWPVKAMPMELWKELEKILIILGYTISWQEGKTNLYEYMDWINSCHLLISCDSLGLHLAHAMNKKSIGLFGPTNVNEVYCYPGCKLITSPTVCAFRPCNANRCESGLICMSHMNLKQIEDAAVQLLQSNTGAV